MLTRIIFILLVALGGAGLAVQMTWNARLKLATGSAVLTTIISVMVTLVSLFLVWASGVTPRGTVPAFASLPKWAWCGGVFAAYYLVATLLGIPRLGTAAAFSLVIAGQMIASLVLDSTGAFGSVQMPLTSSRLAGTVLLLAGVFLMQRK